MFGVTVGARGDGRFIVWTTQGTKSTQGKPGGAITRREWLLSLGSAVVLAGYSGAPGEAATQSAAPGASALPPGLFLPSLDHLTHALTSDDPFHPIPPGAETEYVRPRSGPFVPQAFAREEFPVIRRLVEIILGEDLKNSEETPVPGAPASICDEVAEWIDLVVASAPAVRALALSLPADQRAVAVAYFGTEEPVRELETSEPERDLPRGTGVARRRIAAALREEFSGCRPRRTGRAGDLGERCAHGSRRRRTPARASTISSRPNRSAGSTPRAAA